MNRFLTGVFVSLVCSSCAEYIEMETHEALPIVVNCILREQEEQTLNLFYAKKKTATEYDPVTEADVFLVAKRINKEGRWSEDTVAVFHHDSLDVWRTSYKPQFSTRYKLCIATHDGGQISAETTFPAELIPCAYPKKSFYVDSVYLATSYYFEIREGFHEVIDNITRRTVEYSGSCNYWVFPEEFIIEESRLQRKVIYNTNAFVTDHPFADPISMSSRTYSDFNYCKKNKDRGDYYIPGYSSFMWERWHDIYPPQDTPVYEEFLHINQPAGFTNGLSEEEMLYTPMENTKGFTITGDLYQFITNCRNYRFHFVSDEYDKYLRESYLRDMTKDNMISLYKHDNFYTNVIGGVGIFGAERVKISGVLLGDPDRSITPRTPVYF